VAAPAIVASCFHCGLEVAPGARWRADVLGETRDFCCAGCCAAAEAIAAGGLEDYYRLRSAAAPRPQSRPPAESEDRYYDREELQRFFVRKAKGFCEASLLLEGIRCPACLWLNERRLRALPGVVEVHVGYAAQTARVRWDPSRLSVSGILGAVREIGYEARPFDPSHRAVIEPAASLRDSSRLVFAGAAGMMVMNLSLAAYLAGGPDASGRLPLWETFARWCELAGAAVLLAYPGQDFFAGAWRDLKRRRAGMDVPIVLGLAAAFVGSAWATARGAGPVYFDAIAMLVFFVLLARAFETRARLSAAAMLDRFAVVRPTVARLVVPGGGEREVAALDLSPGDLVRIRPGEICPADGDIVEGASSFDEAILTGEPWPRRRAEGGEVSAGSSNRDQPVLVRVTRAGESSALGEIRRLLEKGLAGRPPFALLADRLAGWLVVAVVAASALTAAWWTLRDPTRALPATVAVLIVTRPCALALASPLALALSAGRLSGAGVLPARMSAIESLATADVAAFDKTGTLTLPAAALAEVATSGRLTSDMALEIAAALETDSTHPIARAILAARPRASLAARAVTHHGGQGVSGEIAGERWWLGSTAFAAGPAAIPPGIAGEIESAGRERRLMALLSDRRGRWALFTFSEEARPGADRIVAELKREGIRRAALLSGDASAAVERLGRSCGFDETRGAMTASDKLDWIRAKQREGARVLFAGDGLNDAPTLAAAAVSVSFGKAPELSRLASDFVILGDDLSPLAEARRIALRSKRILAQNIAWALGYNALALPLAASGALPPWAAALGMSASSLAVVANALRLLRSERGRAVSGGGRTPPGSDPRGPGSEPGR
jgi:P-type Cu2+ transporter